MPDGAVHGQGLAASTSWNRDGKRITPPNRAITTAPPFSGWRSASSPPPWNSGALFQEEDPAVRQRDRTQARVRGAATDQATTLAVWCGALTPTSGLLRALGRDAKGQRRDLEHPRAEPTRHESRHELMLTGPESTGHQQENAN